MNRRYINKRPLCIGDNNTCPNLAGSKGHRTPDSPVRYHTRCDRHRRNGHEAVSFRNPKSRRYIPLNKCDMCNEEAQERHRIIAGSDYLTENVLTLCKDCHRKVHSLNDELARRGFVITTARYIKT